MSKTISLPEVMHVKISELANLEAGQLLDLKTQAEANLQKAKMLKDWVDGAISLKYQNVAFNIRKSQNKDTGTLHFIDDNFKITSVITKRVEWDQNKLKEAVAVIKNSGDNPFEYVNVSYNILESKYTAWPQYLKNIFQPARILKTSKETFAICPLNQKSTNHQADILAQNAEVDHE